MYTEPTSLTEVQEDETLIILHNPPGIAFTSVSYYHHFSHTFSLIPEQGQDDDGFILIRNYIQIETSNF
jgi:hypothetical protein